MICCAHGQYSEMSAGGRVADFAQAAAEQKSCMEDRHLKEQTQGFYASKARLTRLACSILTHILVRLTMVCHTADTCAHFIPLEFSVDRPSRSARRRQNQSLNRDEKRAFGIFHPSRRDLARMWRRSDFSLLRTRLYQAESSKHTQNRW